MGIASRRSKLKRGDKRKMSVVVPIKGLTEYGTSRKNIHKKCLSPERNLSKNESSVYHPNAQESQELDTISKRREGYEAFESIDWEE
ncbi:MAG: hypothetical protein ABSA18_06030 [Dehalococcoidia bacterium]|jgi:hypothetical protein